jgi:ABC-type lipoprotein export system ATPase subunit
VNILKLENVSKYYKSAETVSVGMKNISTTFDIGEFVAVTGESGSGKSTLLNVISGLDGYEDGEVFHYGEETSHFSVSDWERYRSAYVGFVFQNYNIIDSYTVFQNVMFALEVQDYPKADRKKRANELIERVGLSSHRNHKASKLSGGQKQRAVIARALAKDCPIIVADEPTGNLDTVSSKQIMALLHEISKDKLVIVVTHDYDQIKDYATRKIKMHDGEIVEDLKVKEYPKKAEIIKPELKKTSLLSLLRISFRNIFATPKRTLFLLLLNIIVIGVFTLVYSSQIKNINESGLAYSENFPSVPETRLLIERRDGGKFSAQEISQFKRNKNVLEIYENHNLFFNEFTIGGKTESMNYFSSFNKTDSAIILKKNEVNGKLPVAIDEVVVSSSFGNFNIGDTITLGIAYFHYDEYNAPPTFGEFKIVGLDKKERDTIYFSEAYLKQATDNKPQIDYLKYLNYRYLISDNLKLTFLGEDYFVWSMYAERNWDYDVSQYESGPRPEMDVYENQNLTFSVIVEGKELEKTIPNLSIEVFKTNQSKVVFLNNQLYQQLRDDFLIEFEDDYRILGRNLLVVEVSGYYYGNQIIKAVDDDLYKVYYPASINAPMFEFILFINKLLSGVFLMFFGLFLYSIVHAVSKNVMANRKKDFAIYRSIGANQSSLAKLVVIEQVLINLIAFVLTVSLLQILKNYVTVFQNVIPYMRIRDYLLLLLVFLLYGLWLGLRFNKKVFHQSVIETLTMSRGEF